MSGRTQAFQDQGTQVKELLDDGGVQVVLDGEDGTAG